MNSPLMLQTAQEFESDGFFPIPAHFPKGGKPTISATWVNNPKNVNEWSSEFMLQNAIGIGMGGPLHLQTIDVDTKHASNPVEMYNRFLAAMEFVDDADSLYIEKTKSGGLHVIYRLEQEVPRKFVPAHRIDEDGVKHGLIEVLGQGNMVFVSPSPDYEVIQGAINIDDIPIITENTYRQLMDLCAGFDEIQDQRNIDMEIHKECLAKIGSNIGEGGRNNYLTSIAGSFRKKAFTGDEILQIILGVNAVKCHPPLGDDEVERIVRSVCRYDVDTFEAFARDPHGVDLSGLISPELYVERLDKSERPDKIDERLLVLPNEGGELMDFIFETAPVGNKTLAFVGALFAMTGLIERNFCVKGYGTRCNMELLALASSGGGKDHPRKVIRQLFDLLDKRDIVSGQVGTKEGLEEKLAKHPVCLALMDEADQVLDALQRDNGSDQAAKLWNARLELFSSSGSIYTTRVIAGKEERTIFFPFLSVMGSAIPSVFFGALSEKAATKGFLGRCLIFEAGEGELRRSPKSSVPPKSLVDKFIHWTKVKEKNLLQEAVGTTHVIEIDLDIDADEYAFNMRKKYHEMILVLEKNGEVAGSAGWARANELILKLALVNALLRMGPKDAKISLADYKWAQCIVEAQLRRNLWQFEQHACSSDFDKIFKKILSFLEKQGGESSLRELSRKFTMKTKEMEDILDHAKVAGIITEKMKPTKKGGNQRVFSAR